MGTMKKAQFGERVGRSGGRSCGIEKQIRKDERQASRENRQADRQARREERQDARKAPKFAQPKMRYGGKAKKGGSFPDLTGDGKVTRADILKGRGVIKNGGKLKKAKTGSALKKQAATAIAMKKVGKSPKKAMGGYKMMKMGGKCRGGCY